MLLANASAAPRLSDAANIYRVIEAHMHVILPYDQGRTRSEVWQNARAFDVNFKKAFGNIEISHELLNEKERCL